MHFCVVLSWNVLVFLRGDNTRKELVYGHHNMTCMLEVMKSCRKMGLNNVRDSAKKRMIGANQFYVRLSLLIQDKENIREEKYVSEER